MIQKKGSEKLFRMRDLLKADVGKLLLLSLDTDKLKHNQCLFPYHLISLTQNELFRTSVLTQLHHPILVLPYTQEF